MCRSDITSGVVIRLILVNNVVVFSHLHVYQLDFILPLNFLYVHFDLLHYPLFPLRAVFLKTCSHALSVTWRLHDLQFTRNLKVARLPFTRTFSPRHVGLRDISCLKAVHVQRTKTCLLYIAAVTFLFFIYYYLFLISYRGNLPNR